MKCEIVCYPKSPYPGCAPGAAGIAGFTCTTHNMEVSSAEDTCAIGRIGVAAKEAIERIEAAAIAAATKATPPAAR